MMFGSYGQAVENTVIQTIYDGVHFISWCMYCLTSKELVLITVGTRRFAKSGRIFLKLKSFEIYHLII